MDRMDRIDRLTETLLDEVNQHEQISAGEKILATLMLVGDILSVENCTGCRAMITKMIDEELPVIVKAASEHAAKLPQREHSPSGPGIN
jgi:hypothetical protein